MAGVPEFMKIKRLACFGLLLSLLATGAIGQTRGETLRQQGISIFGSGRYDEALRVFREIILDSGLREHHSDAYFWIAKSYIALGQFENASKNLEFFVGEFPDNENYPESLYQRGRLSFLTGEYEASIRALKLFIESYPQSPFVANSYFWVGESLYALGQFDSALEIFSIVAKQYSTSYKVEAARYRISVIELKERERELLKLLKWSHEEYLKALEEFDRKERGYEQALVTYQRTIRDLESRDFETQILSMTQRITVLQSQLEEYRGQLAEAESLLAAAVATSVSPQKQELLDLKEKALDLQLYYLRWLLSSQ
ncbi:MAG: hypothetical protein CMN78_06245 [Spirochaetales bacterium]|nr:hypothetical protein [Spirochaetales bacterium]